MVKIEHKLSPAVAQYAQRSLQQLAEIRKQYLAALGAAKELELAAEAVRLALGQQLAIVQEAEGLPQPVAPYQLSADGTAMIGEIGDTHCQQRSRTEGIPEIAESNGVKANDASLIP